MIQNYTSDLTKGSIKGHLLHLALPASIGFFFNTMYNVVDTFWAGQLSTESLAGLSLNFPLYMLIMALGIGFSNGAGALISNEIGAGREKTSNLYLSQTISLTIILSAILTALFQIFLKYIFIILNGEGEVLASAMRYGRVITGGMVFISLVPVLNSSLVARGNTRTYRNILITGFFLNLALDPLFMYTFGLKEAGVALATIFIQALSLVFLIYIAKKSNAFSGLSFRDFIPEKKIVKEILEQAVPASVNFLTMALGTFVITYYVSSFGSEAVAAYGAAVRVEQIALVPTTGLNMALASLVGQNNGAGRMARVIKSYKTSLLGGALVMIVILPPVLVFGRQIISAFTESEAVRSMGYKYLLIQGITYYSYIVLFQSNSLLQGLKKPAMIMWMGLYRQIAAPAVIFYILSFAFGMRQDGVWWGLVIINWSAAVFTFIWAEKVYKDKCRITEAAVKEEKTNDTNDTEKAAAAE
ncbi:MAG: MATE family efflux transporter [Spirochaetia bacterium]|jgi:putative MATE family efflux protein|nr:MATE family efflux transporter [Spirochaetia bacterium]